MKKFSFILAMVFAASMAMAQKVTTVTQTGDWNTTTVLQNSMDGDANFIFATQSGDYNALKTDQHGNNNYLELLQSGIKNNADMKQFTKGTTPNLNNALLVQSGDWNVASLRQKEDPLLELDNSHNIARMTQSGTYNEYTLNQGTEEWGPKNENFLVQSGDYNKAVLDQIGYTDYSEISQLGDWNKAWLDQTAGSGGAGTATSYSYQEGTKNLLNILQDYDPLSQFASSHQKGISNTTNIKQEGNGAQTVNALQEGSDIIDIKQIGF